MDTAELFHTLPARYPELKGQVALVTGSARGIGKGIALRLGREGMRLLITGLDSGEVEKTTDELRALGVEADGIAGDFNEDGAIEAMFERLMARYGTIDLLVNNAAVLNRKLLLDMPDDMLDHQLGLNVRAPVLCAKRAAALMVGQQKTGSIVSITSVGAIRAHIVSMPYDLTKGAIDALTRGLAVELARYGIRANAVAPGFVLTEGARAYLKDDPTRFDDVIGRIPLARPAKVEEIGAMVAYLASADAAYITGQIMYVDGGISIQLSPPGQNL